MVLSTPLAPQAGDPSPAVWELGRPSRHFQSAMDQGVLVLTITTPQLLDDVLADGFSQDLLTAVANSGVPGVVLDFREVKAVCSAACGLLLHLQRRVQEGG